MRVRKMLGIVAIAAVCGTSANAEQPGRATLVRSDTAGRVEISTVPVPAGISLQSATFTPSGKVLVTYADKSNRDPRVLRLAVMDDDGRNMRPFFAEALPHRDKDNGLRFMVFPDNKRIFLGDFIIECPTSIETCRAPRLYPVDYPPEVATGDHVSHRWSEMIIAPDNRHVAWTTLLSNNSAMVFLGELQKDASGYRIVAPRIISTPVPFIKDPAHPDGVLPQPVNGGEVKQFVDGGRAISLVGASRRNMPASVVQDLASGQTRQITDTPGYTETTILSPDERLGITMTTRFSPRTDPAILGLMPLPYAASLEMGLSMFAYIYSVSGVRLAREGNIGPALIDIAASTKEPGYLGTNLNTQPDWVFYSPMSWHPDGKKAMWVEGQRGSDLKRIQVARLLDYQPDKSVAAKPVPRSIGHSSTDLSIVPAHAKAIEEIDVKVYGRKSGFLTYRRSRNGVTEKTYANFSDDGVATYAGSERMEANPGGRSTYTAKVNLSGANPGTMDLRITFGPLGGSLPAQIVFAPDEQGRPLTRGFVEYEGKRLSVEELLP